MMMSAEDRAVVLADMQLRERSYLTPDPDERDENDTATNCIVCDAPLVPRAAWSASAGRIVMRKPTAGQKVCRECNQKGWRSKPCVVCGGPTKTWAWGSKSRRLSTRGMCDGCRKEWHLNNPVGGAGNSRARYMTEAA